jgi:O-antigen/teichoic acid export membrane protein
LGIIIRQSIKNTIISYLGIILGFVTTILLFPRFLTADQYGLTRLFLSIVTVAAQFCHLGMKKIIIRFFPYFDQMEGSRYNLLFLSFAIPMTGFLAFVGIYFLFEQQFIYYFKDDSALFKDYYFYLLPLLFSVLFFEVLNSYVRALKDAITGSFINEVVLRLGLMALLIIYYYNLISFTQFVLFFVLTYAMQPIALVVYLYYKGELSFSLSFLSQNKRFKKLVSVYGMYSLLGSISTVIIGNIDILMLSSMADLSSTAVYFIAFAVGSVIVVPQRSILKIATPILADLLKNREMQQIDSLYKRTSITQIIGGSLIFVGIWANMHNLMDLLPSEYHGAQWVIIVIGLARLFDMSTGINGVIISNSKYYRFDLYVNLLLVALTITTNYLLIPIYGILGAALATALTVFIYNFIKFVYVWIKFSMQPFQWNALGVLIIAGGCLLGSFQLPYLGSFVVDVAVRSLLITAVFTGLVFVFNLSDDINRLLTQGVQRGQSLFDDFRN